MFGEQALWIEQGPGSSIKFTTSFAPASAGGQGPRERQRLTHCFCRCVRYRHVIEASLGDVHRMHAGKSLDVGREPGSQETYRGREVLNDGFSWIRGSPSFSLLTVTARGGRSGRGTCCICRGRTPVSCGLGADTFRKIPQGMLQALHLILYPSALAFGKWMLNCQLGCGCWGLHMRHTFPSGLATNCGANNHLSQREG